MTRQPFLGATIALGAFLLATPVALAAGTEPVEAPKCPSGQIYDEGEKKCVEKSAASPESLYEEAVRLARVEEDFSAALEILRGLDQEDPKVLNYIGYSTRKSGDILMGMTYYYKALERNPDYVLARAYLGEGYLQLGRLDLAEQQLEEIASRCGASCSEYAELEAAIAKARG